MRIPKSERGSVLIVAAILMIIIEIALLSYLQLSRNSWKLANRSFYFNAAMNLVDVGMEQALWSLNNDNWTGAGFSQPNLLIKQYQATFPSSSTYYPLSQQVKGQVKVWADLTGTVPHVVAKAIVTLGDGTKQIKEAEIYAQRRSYFANGLVAKNQITFSGNNAGSDSWNSDPDNNPSTAAIAYSSSVAHDHAEVASASVQVDSINVSNADIYGYVAVGGTSSNDVQVGPQGLVGPYGTQLGTIDTSHVTYDFTTSFPDVGTATQYKDATGVTQTISYQNVLPINGTIDLPGSSGATAVTDSTGTTTYYISVASISLNSSDALNIRGAYNSTTHTYAPVNVVVKVTNTISTPVSVTGNGSIQISPGSSLTLYTSGDVSIAGNGVSNGSYDPTQPLSATNAPNQPKNFAVYGTRPTVAPPATQTYQDIKIAGNGILSGIVYAPNSALEIKGGGSSGQVLGAAVANTVLVTGNSIFHYDESLANHHSSDLWKLTKWCELASAADRAIYDHASQLNF